MSVLEGIRKSFGPGLPDERPAISESVEVAHKDQLGQWKPWVMRYRHPVEGYRQGTIYASSIRMAEKVGRRWCANQESVGPGKTYTFVNVSDPVLADETILTPEDLIE